MGKSRTNYEEGIPITDQVRPNDVLLGRGSSVSKHPGNSYFRKHVQSMKPEYQGVAREAKRAVAEMVLDEIAARGGRFIELSDGIYSEVPLKRAHQKISQALREKRSTEDRRAHGTSGISTSTAVVATRKQETATKKTVKPTKTTKTSKVAKKKAAKKTVWTSTKTLRLKLKNLKLDVDVNGTMPSSEVEAPSANTVRRSLKAPTKSSKKNAAKSTKRKSTKAKTKKVRVTKTKDKAKTTKKKSAVTSTTTIVPVANETTNATAKDSMTIAKPKAIPPTSSFAHPGLSTKATKVPARPAPAGGQPVSAQEAPTLPTLAATPSMVLFSALFPPLQDASYLPSAMECLDGRDGVSDFGDRKMVEQLANRIVVSPTSIMEFEAPDGFFSHIAPGDEDIQADSPLDNLPSFLHQKDDDKVMQQQQQQESAAKLETALTMNSPPFARDSIVAMPSDFLVLQRNLLENTDEGNGAAKADDDEPMDFPM